MIIESHTEYVTGTHHDAVNYALLSHHRECSLFVYKNAYFESQHIALAVDRACRLIAKH